MVLFGPDLSHFQAGFDFKRAAAEGMQFCVGKISQGAGMKDTQWPKTRDQGRAAGLIVIGYHYIDGTSPAAQAANCAAWIGDRAIPVALDWEAGGGNYAQLAAVTAAFRKAGLNVRLVYTGAWYWQPQGSPDLRPLGLALWKSRYPSTAPGSPAGLYAKVPTSYWAGLGGLDTRLLQFTDHAAIAGMSTDCSAFLGTRDQLAALLGGTTSQEVDVQLPTLREGDGRKAGQAGVQHWYVLSAQALLNVRGLSKPVTQDGVFGPVTTAMVKELQARNHLTADGVIGPVTWMWLLGNPAPDFA